MLKTAYDFGVQCALNEMGLVKAALGPDPAGEIASTLGGGLLGGGAGSAGGAGLGALVALLAKQDPSAAARFGARWGGTLGGVGGTVAGFQNAMSKRHQLF